MSDRYWNPYNKDGTRKRGGAQARSIDNVKENYFKPGNKMQQLKVDRHGPIKIKSEEELWNKSCEYFKWVEDNPIKKKKKTVTKQGDIVQYIEEYPRVMTYAGLCCYLGVSHVTLSNWRDQRDKCSFGHIMDQIDNIIKENKFSGAAAGIFNAGLVARDLGLADKREVQQNNTHTINGVSFTFKKPTLEQRKEKDITPVKE